MRPGKNDIKAEIKFDLEELKLLKENTWQMAESFGLDDRIDRYTGKRKIGLYRWDLDLLVDVISNLQKGSECNQVVGRILIKLNDAFDYINFKKKN